MILDRVTVRKEREDRLWCQSWEFVRLDQGLVLDSYAERSRPSTRHKFTTQAYWSRLNRRMNSIAQTAVPLPQEIIDEAMETYLRDLRANLTVGFQR